jgi:hypothetical protein
MMSSFSACCAVLPAAVLFKFNQSRPSQKEAAAGAANNGQQQKELFAQSSRETV